MVVWVSGEAIGLVCPCLADELVWCEPAKALEAAGEIVGGDEVVEVSPELIVAVVVESLDGRVLDGAIHSLDVAVGPRMVDAGEAVLDAMLGAAQVEHVREISRGGAIGVARR